MQKKATKTSPKPKPKQACPPQPWPKKEVGRSPIAHHSSLKQFIILSVNLIIFPSLFLDTKQVSFVNTLFPAEPEVTPQFCTS